MPKPDPEAKRAFEALVAFAPGATVKPMFGNFAAFKGGLMFAGVFGDQVFVRLSEADRQAAMDQLRVKLFEPMKGRPMKEYVCLPAAVLADTKMSRAWVAKSLKYVGTLPPKKA